MEQHPADRGKPDHDRGRDRPSADADGADGLPRAFVLGDLAVAQFVFLVRVVHRPALPVSVKLVRLASSARKLAYIAAVVDARKSASNDAGRSAAPRRGPGECFTARGLSFRTPPCH